jgi:hypothetical protein
MKIYKVNYRFAYNRPVYFVVDELVAVDTLSKKHNAESEIISIELISDEVINQWAQ